MDLEDFLIIDSNKTSYERYESLLDALSNDDGLRLIHKAVTCKHADRNEAINTLYDFLEHELKSQIQNYNDQRSDTYEVDDYE